MRLISRWLFRLKAIFSPGRLEEAMNEEMAFHIEMEARKLMAEGVPPSEALKEARRSFGEPEYHKEKARESWGIGMFQNFRTDGRHTLRSLRRNPGFAFVAILTLGLGIGATTAIFSVVNGILLRDLPFPDPERLVFLCEARPGDAGACHTASTPNVADWEGASRAFDEIGVFRWWGHILQSPEGSRGVSSLIATPGFFSVMGYRPFLGRVFQSEDQEEGNRNRVVLDYDFWTTQFGADEDILGSTIFLGGSPYEVLGVLEPGQKPPDLEGQGADLWLPLHFDPRDEERRDWRGFYAVGRLSSDASLGMARQELGVIHRELREAYPEANAEWGLQLQPLHGRVVGSVRDTLIFFLAAVGLVLLITCANIANLILARLSGREPEMGIRTALGAGTSRLTGQLLTEGFVLALLGAALGLTIAFLGTPLLLSMSPPGIPRLDAVEMNGTVLAFALAVTVLSTLLFAMAPLARLSRTEPMDALRMGHQGRRRGPLGGLNGTLVATEVALALALLVGAGLLIRSFVAFNGWEPGIDREHILVMSASVSTGGYRGPDEILEVYRILDDELMALPGVRSVARASAGPLFGGFEPDEILPAESADSRDPGLPIRWYDVSPGYFETLDLDPVRGRLLNPEDDASGTPVAVVNETLARRLWPHEDPVGREVWLQGFDQIRQVVGVVRDIPPLDPDAAVDAEMFWPQAQATRSFTYFIVRTERDLQSVRPLLRDRIRAVDPAIQVGPVWDYDTLLSSRLVQPRFNMVLIAVFSALALTLAGVGIYGVVSRSVVTRTREIGIRIALGAERTRVIREVVMGALRMVGLGIVAGLILALALSGLIRSLLHGVAPSDPLTYGGVALVLVGVAVAASLIPAYAASRVDPIGSLREE